MRIEVNLIIIKRTILSNIIKHFEIINLCFTKLQKNDSNDLFFFFFFLIDN